MKAIFLSACRSDRSVYTFSTRLFGWGRVLCARAIHYAFRAAGRLLGFVPTVQIQTHKKDILRSVKSKL